MRTTVITCETCQAKIAKSTKEVNRRRKLGKKMYCNLSCSGKQNHSHLPTSSTEHMIMMSKLASVRNKKWTAEQKPFAEHLRRASNRKKNM